MSALLSGLLGLFVSGTDVQQYSDDFNRADGAIGASWLNLLGVLRVLSNAAAPTTSVDTVAMYDSASVLNDQYSQVGFVSGTSGSNFPGVACCLAVDGAGGRGYIYSNAGDAGGGSGLFRFSAAGGFVSLSGPAQTFVAGDVMRITAAAGRVKVFKNGTQIIDVADSTYTSGKPGIYAYGAGALQDNWQGGAL